MLLVCLRVFVTFFRAGDDNCIDAQGIRVVLRLCSDCAPCITRLFPGQCASDEKRVAYTRSPFLAPNEYSVHQKALSCTARLFGTECQTSHAPKTQKPSHVTPKPQEPPPQGLYSDNPECVR